MDLHKKQHSKKQKFTENVHIKHLLDKMEDNKKQVEEASIQAEKDKIRKATMMNQGFGRMSCALQSVNNDCEDDTCSHADVTGNNRLSGGRGFWAQIFSKFQ